MKKEKSLLKINNMSVSFDMYKKALDKRRTKTISNLSIDVFRGEVLAIVGSSGSGKSLLAHSIMGILPSNALVGGEFIYKGEKLTEKKLKSIRGKDIVLVPQSISYLDPLMKVGRQVRRSRKDKDSKSKQRRSFKRYNLCEKSEELYPHQLSGGMARRVLVSTADQSDASLIIADEPTPGLDIDIARKTLKYFREFADKGKSVILITHDIDLALDIADRIAVLYAGTIVEIAKTKDFNKGITFLRHPYTKALFEALPQNGFKAIKGSQPSNEEIERGCLFYPRCSMRTDICKENVPMRELREGMVRCCHAV
ncbi:MAG: ABC transporter ATP-binding protein [Tissierella sp.]|uniref:ABC transporter ATP-binding protein n=1 Tax=Tissierella sp. TaxID=41274 RepID=UPI003F963FD6